MAVALVLVMIVSAVSAIVGSARAAPAPKHAAPAPAVTITAAPTAPAPAALPSRTLKIGWIAMSIGTTNPIHITLDDEYPMVYNVYSTLITYDSQYHPKPDLAQKWWVYNSTAYEMYLTPNAYWTDPRNPTDRTHGVNGYDIQFSYENYSKNVGQMDLFTDYVREIDTVWVDPANAFHIIVNFKIPYAPAMETFGTMFILPKYIWSVQGFTYSNPLPIGSGPYMVRPDPAHTDKMLKPPPALYLDRNPNWHGPSALGWQIFPNTLEIDSYTTSAAMSQDLVLGVIDTVMTPEPTEWMYYLKDKPGIIRQSVPHAFVAEVGINLMTPALRAANPQRFRGTNSQILQNQVVRVALQMTVNRQKMIDNALLGLGQVADTLVPPVSPWHYDFPNYASTMPAWSNYSDPILGPYTALEEFPDNTAASGTQSSTYLARALLMKEGWKYTSAGAPAALDTTPLCKAGGADCLSFRFYTLSDVNWWKTAADGMVADAAKAGIQLNLVLYGTTQMNNQVWWTMDYDIWLWDWMFTPNADPSTGILSVETCENLLHGTSNDNGFCLRDPVDGHWVYDDLYNQSIRTTDPVARRALTDEMQRIIYQYGGYNLPFYRREIYAMNEVRWTHWGDWATNPALPEDVGLNSLIGGQVWPVDHKPPQVAELPTYTGVVGHPVQFSTVATDPNGIPLKYSWDFDDRVDVNHDWLWTNDNEATTATASHTYAAAGTYNVTVRVSEDTADARAEWFTQKTTTVTVVGAGSGSPVVTGLSYGPADPSTSDPAVDLSAAAYDPAGFAMTYSWDFGDGTTAGPFTTPLTSHPFPNAGDYEVKVTVTSSGGSAQRSTIFSVIPNGPPTVSGVQDQQIQEGNLLTMTAFASDPNARDLLTYSWNFGDGSAAATNNPVTHIYAAQGGSPTPYTLTLSVRDTPPGATVPLHTTTVTALITVIPRGPDQAPTGTITATPASGTTTQDITFTLVASDPEGDPLHWSMDFNCANPKHCTNIAWSVSTSQTRPNQVLTQTVVHRYSSSGTFTATAFVDDLDKWNQTFQYPITISMNHVPTLTVISATPASPIPHEVVTFSSVATDSDGDVLHYTWNFGDATSDSGSSPAYGGQLTATHDFAGIGDYTVTLSVDDTKGGTAERQLVISVAQANRAPTVSAISAPHYALIGATIDFSADVADLNGDTLTYAWDFGDGSAVVTGTTPVPATLTGHHVFTTEATFTVTLTVDDGHGGISSSPVDIIATSAPPTDTTPPVTTYALTGTMGLAAWYTSAVTVALTATDDLSTVPWTNYSIDSGAWKQYAGPFAVSGDGTHTLEYNSTDAVGNDELTNTATVKVDTTPPMMTDAETGTTAGAWYTDTVTVTLTASDAASGVASQSYRIDGAAWQTYSAPFTVSAEGRHVVDYRVADVAGLAFTNTVNVDVDLSAPVTSSTLAGTAGANGWYTTAVTVSLNAVDTLSSIAETDYRVDGGGWAAYSTSFGVTTEGTHIVEFNSTDNAGHAETTVTVTVKIDTVAPATTATLSGTKSGTWYMTAVSVTLTATDATSLVASTSYRLDGGTWTAYTTAIAVAEGSHAIDYRSTDNAGNLETASTSTIDVDTTGPSTMITRTGSVGSNGWYTTSVSVSLAATDAGSGVASVRYRLDGGSWATYSAAFSVTAEGPHAIDYNASDMVGNAETVHSAAVNIDTTAPTASLTPAGTSGTNGWYTSAVAMTVAGTDATSGVGTREIRLDGGAWTAYSTPVPVSGDGTHTVEARVTDNAGLVSSVQTATLKIDATAPVISNLAPTGTVTSTPVTVTWTGSDATGSGIANYTVKVDDGTPVTVGTATSTTLDLADGDYTITVTATDLAGNSASSEVQLTVSTTAGPVGGLDTVTIIAIVVVVAAAALGAVWFFMHRKKMSPPNEPPVHPPEP